MGLEVGIEFGKKGIEGVGAGGGMNRIGIDVVLIQSKLAELCQRC